ncbi:non-homologous end-joining DNA ligase [Rhizomonospora bruguierae]|uniref:non-homologous end-joining DNA ligase n=1 Tax=Rhizomonospora bruguierae TaxID=1581705 RepID=UPI001BCF702F|nr:non-homologous end-joining DNA ligase [Micromonospora sp. NBRC 107566]
MLAVPGGLPASPGWAYEFKWDGVRAVAVVRDGAVRLWARSGAEITTAYPELAGLRDVAGEAVLDGEVVVLTEAGRPSFTLLAERMHVREPARAAHLAATLPITYMIFDLLRLGGLDLTGLPYAQRREHLEALGIAGARWAVPPVFADGRATYAAAMEHGLEGVVAKRLTSVYRPGLRSADWLKVKLEESREFVVGGWRPGVRRVGGLLVGLPAVQPGRLTFHGRVGGGIGAAAERALLAALEPLRAARNPFVRGTVPRADAKGAIWVQPVVVVEVKYGQRTPDGRLRFPRFLRIRPDLTPEEVAGATG